MGQEARDAREEVERFTLVDTPANAKTIRAMEEQSEARRDGR
jgi:hypothetical protein